MNDKTQHSVKTEFGYNTPHKYPDSSINVVDELNSLVNQLYPTGRAWYGPENGVFDKLHEAFNLSFSRLIRDGLLAIDKNIPDNDSFSEEDATLWEYRLGLITNQSVDLQLRRLAIKRKLGHPNNIKARQHPLFIQSQLQAAGFDVFVHQNEPPYQTPLEVLNIELTEVQHGGITQHGNSTQHGGDNFDVIANSIEPIENYAIGGAEYLWATFFIGAEIFGNFATVPLNRLREFKELVIKLKPAHTVAFTFINYT